MADPKKSLFALPQTPAVAQTFAPGATPTTHVVPTVRAQAPGGQALTYVQSKALLWFERVYRTLPPEGMYNATPNDPVSFTLGSYQVPQDQVLVVTDYAFDIYRFSGAAAGDFVPLEANRLSTQVGWDITISGNTRDGDVGYQIIPAPATLNRQQFADPRAIGRPAQAWQFDLARQMANQGAVPAAASLMPQRRTRPGLMQVNNNYVANSNSTISVVCSVIRQIPIPIGFFEATICGILMPQIQFAEYQKALVPFGDPNVNNLPGTT
jgi:hypothetical protein